MMRRLVAWWQVRRDEVQYWQDAAESLAAELERLEKANADLCAELEQVEESRRRYATRAGVAERERDCLRLGAYTPDAQATIRRLTRELDQQRRNAARLDDLLAAAEGRPVQGVA